MSNSSISVVLPVYNGEQYLRQSIQSILNQTHRNWELLLIDDCSTDSTPEIIAEFRDQDTRIKSVRNKKNKRLPGSLNTGFRMAAGEYVTWTSDDNLYKPTAFQEMADHLDNNPDIAFIYADSDIIDEDGNTTEVVEAGDWKKLGLTDVIGGCFMYRRAIHEAVGYYDENTYLAEDLEFELRAMVNGFKFHPMARNLYQYRDHPDSLTNTKSRQIYRIHGQVIREYFPRMPWMDATTRVRAFLQLARKAFSIRDFSAVIQFIFYAFGQSPWLTLKTIFLYPIQRRFSE